MSSFRAVLLAALVVVGAALLVPFVGAAVLSDGDGVQTEGINETDGNETDVGTQMSSFMQTSTASATSAVEDGMFEAEYEAADNRTVVVDRRADRIERQIADLQERKQRIAEREGQMSEVAYNAQMSRIAGEIEALERQINATKSKAEAVGAGASRFDRLNENVSSLRGPRVAEAAKTVPGRGPPGDTPGGQDGAGEQGPPEDSPGQNDDAPQQSGDEDAGEGNGQTPGSDDGGTGDASSTDGGTDDQAGSDDGSGDRGTGGNAPLLR
jgi:polyhydroxyalkanoate synthesis regulator phasin